ncbi:MAG: TauD/TfdA family dioxygenase [Proteobacteria bacterium]|nr:TauD/TfdA family dioxygenase [Pelagibacterales bacterium]MDA1135675.1 TauD/TfdA family dioxygenase [Pseudomonadota bacterium]
MIIKTRDLFPDFVGFVSDINLKEILSDSLINELDAAVNKYAVLVFKDQNITDHEQVRFTEYFGKIEASGKTSNITKDKDRRLSSDLADVSNLDKDNKPFTLNDPRRIFNLGNRLWHTDSSFKPVPAKYSLLSGRNVSKEGGNTEFADMRSAYDNLDFKIKNKIEKMICEHSLIYSRQRLGFDMVRELSPDEIKNFKPVEQPLVRNNKLTNRKTVFLSSHIGKIKDWTRPDSMCFIDDLIEYATKEKFLYVHKWLQNDLVIWDNRQTMHRARAFDDLTEYRDMRRTTVLGEEKLI